jgi:hypothetical protein
MKPLAISVFLGFACVAAAAKDKAIREFVLDERTVYTITDGSAGLRGRLVKTDDMAEIKLFAATLLSGAASSLTDREQTIFGSITSPTLRNAPLKGAQDVLGTYAKQIYDSIQRDGFYVRVPAGKQFYLYVTQTIDNSDATAGGTILTDAAPEISATNATPSVPPQPFLVPNQFQLSKE